VAWASYGGRGITVCARWDSYENFRADVGPRPSPAHTLDRIDNDRGYEPGNVRWATPVEQARNRRGNVRLTLNGITRTVVEWAAMLALGKSTIRYRLKRGWPVERALKPGDVAMRRGLGSPGTTTSR